MSSRSFDNVSLERALTDLGPRLAFPPEPDLARRVVATIRERSTAPAVIPRPRWSLRALAFGTAVLVLGAFFTLALSPAAREAVADFLGIGGVRIEVGPPGPLPTTPPGENLSLGVRTTLEDAQARVNFPVQLPDALGLDEPDAVYFSDFPEGGRVSFAYRAREGIPRADETGLGVLITQFQGAFQEELLKKSVGRSQIRFTDVDLKPAYFVRGPHTFFYVDSEGGQRSETLRLSANALIWTDGDVTLRIESELGLEDARAIAESMD